MFVLVLIILILIILCIILGQKPPTPPYYSTHRKNINIVTTENNNNVIDYKKYYKAKRYVITLNELKFYNVLTEIAKELELFIFAQVSLYNILNTKSDLDYKTKTIYFNKIASKISYLKTLK